MLGILRTMRSAQVEDIAEYWCGAIGGVWAIVPVANVDGARQLAPEDGQRLGSSVITQMARCRVDGNPVLLVYAHYSKLATEARTALAQTIHAQFDGAPVLVVMETSRASLRLTARSELATKTSVRRRSSPPPSSWDESKRIRIEDGEHCIEVEPSFDGKRWAAAAGPWRSLFQAPPS
jgi:hypothetical protein